MGFLGSPWFHFRILGWLGGEGSAANAGLLITTTILITSGAALAFILFRNPEAAESRLRNGRGPLRLVLERKFFIDDVYEFLTKKVGLGIAAMFAWFDRNFANGFLVNGTSYRILDLGKITSKIQNGLLQDYLSWAVGVGILVAFWLVKSNTGIF